MTMPQFIDRDPDQITRELVDQYESLSGRTLYPAQVERLLINIMAYRETLIREAIQDAALQNLVNYARAPMLDELGVLVGCTRLPPETAKTEIRFTLRKTVAVQTIIPKGTRVESNNGDVVFATDEALTIGPNQTDGVVWASCETAGSIGNGWVTGAINRIIDDTANVATASNVTATSGGADAETDEHYRDRIKLAPETFSVAGSVEAYQYHALSAHPDIVDVAVVSPDPGDVVIYPLTKTGLPSESVINAVLEQCSGRKVRPLTDRVTVTQPVAIEYAINASITLYSTSDQTSTMAAAQTAIEAWRDSRAATLGNDIVPSQMIAALSVTGVYRVDLAVPATTMVIEPHQWPQCTGITLTFAGFADG